MITDKQIESSAGDYAIECDCNTLSDAFEDGAKWAIEQLQPEIDALRAENERLRDGLNSIYDIQPKDAIQKSSLSQIYEIIGQTLFPEPSRRLRSPG